MLICLHKSVFVWYGYTMEKIFLGKANLSGIYRIINLTNGRIYVGSTSRFRTRAASHINDLQKNRHNNTFLQNDYNKNGDSFVFEVLEVVEGSQEGRLKVEQKYIDEHYDNQKQCYNLTAKAVKTRKGCQNRKPYDPTTDGRSRVRTTEENEARRKTSSEYWNKPERRKFASERAKKKWAGHKADITVRHVETGETVYVDKSLRKFCEERNLMYKAFHLLSKGHTKKSQGWIVVAVAG